MRKAGVPSKNSATIVALGLKASILPLRVLNSARVISLVRHSADAGVFNGVNPLVHVFASGVSRILVVVGRSFCACRQTSCLSLVKVTSHSTMPAPMRAFASLNFFNYVVQTTFCLCSMHLLIFGHELDPHQSPRERAPRDRLSGASRCARGRDVEGADRHDQPRACVRRPRRWLVPDLAHVRRADRDRQDDRAHRHVPGRFVKLVTNEQVVEVVEFETVDPALRGEMTITITLADTDGGTDVLAVHDGLPPGVSTADNEAGWREALAKLAALVEAGF